MAFDLLFVPGDDLLLPLVVLISDDVETIRSFNRTTLNYSDFETEMFSLYPGRKSKFVPFVSIFSDIVGGKYTEQYGMTYLSVHDRVELKCDYSYTPNNEEVFESITKKQFRKLIKVHPRNCNGVTLKGRNRLNNLVKWLIDQNCEYDVITLSDFEYLELRRKMASFAIRARYED